MLIAGLQKTTLVDYPGHLACTVFTSGCNFRCHFCHNPELVKPQGKVEPILSNTEFFTFLQSRKGLLEGVCITGGEPTLHPDLPEFIREIKELGYKVKLDSNGTNPQILETLIASELVDYIAMDLKNDAENYEATVGTSVDLEKIKQSVKLLLRGKVSYEFRTTVVPGLHSVTNFHQMGQWIRGAHLYVIQNFKPGQTLNPDYATLSPFESTRLEEFKKIMQSYVQQVQLR